MKKKIRLGDILSLASGALVIALIVGFVIWEWPHLKPLFANPEQSPQAVRDYIAGFGLWAPVIFVGLYVLQIVVAPIPGTLMNFAGGLLFGWLGGIGLSWVSCIIGAAISIAVIRRFGRSLMRIFMSDEKIDKFDSYVRTRGWVYLFLLYIIPNPIGDAVNYMSALSDIKFWKLLIMVGIGRIPSLVVGSWLGTQSLHFKLIHWILLGVGFVVLLVGVYIIHKPIENLAIKLSAKLFPEKKPGVTGEK
ncbi:TVP38/TMEM64 family protein [candidate division WOR-3 bacterium]|nr:TVP38/TMEM64 family protein [candidate division WOR-3 bacterium]